MGAERSLVDPHGAGKGAQDLERPSLALGKREKEVDRRRRKARCQQREAAAVARDDRLLLAGEGGKPLARHLSFLERGEEAVSTDLLLDLGEVAAKLVVQRSTRRFIGGLHHRDLPSLA